MSRTSFYSTRCNGAASGNGEHVFDGKKEGLIGFTLGRGDIFVDFVHELKNALAFGSCKNVCVRYAGRSLFKSFERRTFDDGAALKAVAFKRVGYFHFNELEKFGVVHLVALVEEYNDVRNAYLTGKKNVLLRLGHGTVGRCNYEDCAVHLRSARNHVLYIVCVSRTVNVRIVALVGLIFDVSGVYRYTARLLFGRFVDFVVLHFFCLTLACHNHSDSCGQSGLAVVNVADCADVNVGLAVVVLSLCHFCFSLLF